MNYKERRRLLDSQRVTEDPDNLGYYLTRPSKPDTLEQALARWAADYYYGKDKP